MMSASLDEPPQRNIGENNINNYISPSKLFFLSLSQLLFIYFLSVEMAFHLEKCSLCKFYFHFPYCKIILLFCPCYDNWCVILEKVLFMLLDSNIDILLLNFLESAFMFIKFSPEKNGSHRFSQLNLSWNYTLCSFCLTPDIGTKPTAYFENQTMPFHFFLGVLFFEEMNQQRIYLQRFGKTVYGMGINH